MEGQCEAGKGAGRVDSTERVFSIAHSFVSHLSSMPPAEEPLSRLGDRDTPIFYSHQSAG
ncbi:hypothetical protein SNOG_11681 [Parastagonospora nodorum SN15]|uniref:Uncharacterized protein n=1 Tax=Phaeosphaeria nodorum (strain SN15 / ATCC MYA-4574 / FGSC 10173) TaxID=321614 RepID=Q0U983_PHANO|nr:hypothetical protein SNOG_11681 [Parastagonospora nodorum SN15]EAT80725.1 hypothetical protein SNOG_11681 [Parastagonospora nodorum SN15]